MKELLKEIRSCQICQSHLPLGTNPVLRCSEKAKIMVIGQAPGTRVHKSGIPWDDPSGRRLREWMGLDDKLFYDQEKVAIVPMGFCYPGKGKSGDLPPRKECAPQWHDKLWSRLPNIELTLLIGQYAQNYYLKSDKRRTLTDTVMSFEDYLPEFLPLPHPSPRNYNWLLKNPWFEKDVLPILRKRINLAFSS